MWLVWGIVRICLTAKKSKETVQGEAYTTRSHINKIRTRLSTCFVKVLRKEKLEHLVTTGMIEEKRSRGKQREKMVDGLTK